MLRFAKLFMDEEWESLEIYADPNILLQAQINSIVFVFLP